MFKKGDYIKFIDSNEELYQIWSIHYLKNGEIEYWVKIIQHFIWSEIGEVVIFPSKMVHEAFEKTCINTNKLWNELNA